MEINAEAYLQARLWISADGAAAVKEATFTFSHLPLLRGVLACRAHFEEGTFSMEKTQRFCWLNPRSCVSLKFCQNTCGLLSEWDDGDIKGEHPEMENLKVLLVMT